MNGTWAPVFSSVGAAAVASAGPTAPGVVSALVPAAIEVAVVSPAVGGLTVAPAASAAVAILAAIPHPVQLTVDETYTPAASD